MPVMVLGVRPVCLSISCPSYLDTDAGACVSRRPFPTLSRRLFSMPERCAGVSARFGVWLASLSDFDCGVLLSGFDGLLAEPESCA